VSSFPQERANELDVAHVGVGTSDEGVYLFVCKSEDIAPPPPPPAASSSSSSMPTRVQGQTYQRFTTVTRHAPVWHSVGGERFHSSPDCRGLRGANGIKLRLGRLCAGRCDVEEASKYIWDHTAFWPSELCQAGCPFIRAGGCTHTGDDMHRTSLHVCLSELVVMLLHCYRMSERES
jgi:hypothetical protein